MGFCIDIAGKGVGVRMHKPILDELSIDNKFVRLPDNSHEFYEFKTTAKMIIIGTPTYKHISHIKIAQKTYPLVLCEKPVGNSLDDILELAEDSSFLPNRILVNYQLRMLDITSQIRSQILNLNKAISKVNVVYRSNARGATSLPHWYTDFSLGGGVLYSLFSHIIDFVLFVGLSVDTRTLLEVETKLDEVNVILESTTKVPISISINTKSEYDEFTFSIYTDDVETKYDFITDNRINKNEKFQYANGTLSSKERIPWRLGFLRLINSIVNLDYRYNDIATIDDAIKVHCVMSQIANYYEREN